jgi:hypothetical protein
MDVTPEERGQLAAILRESMERAGPFVRASFEWPEHALSLDDLLALFGQMRVVTLATVTSAGAPRVAPVGCLLVGAAFCIPTVRSAARCRMVARRPDVSFAYTEERALAVIVHGRGSIVGAGDALFDRCERALAALGIASPTTWGDPAGGCYLIVAPETIFTYCRDV